MLYKQKYILLFINNIFKVLLTKMGHDFMEQILRLWQALCFGIETDLEKIRHEIINHNLKTDNFSSINETMMIMSNRPPLSEQERHLAFILELCFVYVSEGDTWRCFSTIYLVASSIDKSEFFICIAIDRIFCLFFPNCWILC